MNSIKQQALNGTLKSNPTGDPFDCVIKNDTNIGLIYQSVLENSLLSKADILLPGNEKHIEGREGSYIIVKVIATGGFFDVYDLSHDGININVHDLSFPNEIGEIPKQSKEMIVPNNSPKVIVGIGKLSNDSFVIREQYWNRSHESYSLAPNEQRTINFTQKSGIDESSSSMEKVAESISSSVNAGWGAFSAKISASLNMESSRTQETSFHTESKRETTIEFTNKTDSTLVYLKWQLMDVYSIIGSGEMAQIIVAQNPGIYSQPYNPIELI